MFSRWFAAKPRRPERRFQPALCVLEDRTVPHAVASGPATHLGFVVPQHIASGKDFSVLVKAYDASNHVARNYTGTVHFALSTADATAIVPADYTFTANDRGTHRFHFTLIVTGSQTITATDTVTATITGSATTTVDPAPVATHFTVFAPRQATQGVPTYVTVVARDASNHKVPNYQGTVAITSNNAGATLPANYTFTTTDHGVHTFQVILPTPGTTTITATDTTTASITGQATLTVNAVGPVSHFGIFAIGGARTGKAESFFVAALDANNRVVASYTGTVHFTSTDPSAVLPADYTFVAGDYGSHVFSVTFNTKGKQSLTATDTVTATIIGSRKVHVHKGKR